MITFAGLSNTPKLDYMIPMDVIHAMDQEATSSITLVTNTRFSYSDHITLAELYFNRAEIRLAGHLLQRAFEDYETCLMYDPYYYAAADRMAFLQSLTNKSTTSLDEHHSSHRLAS